MLKSRPRINVVCKDLKISKINKKEMLVPTRQGLAPDIVLMLIESVKSLRPYEVMAIDVPKVLKTASLVSRVKKILKKRGLDSEIMVRSTMVEGHNKLYAWSAKDE